MIVSLTSSIWVEMVDYAPMTTSASSGSSSARPRRADSMSMRSILLDSSMAASSIEKACWPLIASLSGMIEERGLSVQWKNQPTTVISMVKLGGAGGTNLSCLAPSGVLRAQPLFVRHR